MDRKYFICNDLDELESTQNELVKNGFNDHQLHILSDDDAGVENHHLHPVNSLSKTDIVHSTLRGAFIGVGISAGLIAISTAMGITNDIGFLPFIFMAIIALGFSAWEGGLWGIQEINHHFKAFESLLRSGKHVMIIDYAAHQKTALDKVVQHHPSLQAA